MAITFGSQPPVDEDAAPTTSRAKGSSRRPGDTQQVVYQKEARSPRGLKAVYVETLTHARATQAAAEFGVNLNEMVEVALRDHLKREAGALFEREFRAEQEKADATRSPTPQRWEFERSWRPPAWTRE